MRIGIAGAGLMGRLLAHELLYHGHEVLLFDEDDINGTRSCAMTAAGMVSLVSEKGEMGSLLPQIGGDSLKRWPQILARLEDPVFFAQEGAIFTALSHDYVNLARIIHLLQREEWAAAELKILKIEEIREMEPHMRNVTHAYYLKHEGQIDNQSLLPALAKALLNHPHLQWFPNTKIYRLFPGGLATEEKVYEVDWAMDCRGLGAKDLFKDLRGVRGEVITVHAPEVEMRRPLRVWHPRHSIYIVPRPDHRFIIGASEIESEDFSPISILSTLELLTAAYSVHEGFAEARILHTSSHCRPALMDNKPRIHYAPGLVAINGLYRYGYSLAPALAGEVLRIITQPQNLWCYPQLVRSYEEMVHD